MKQPDQNLPELLLVEDDPILLKRLKIGLEEQGYRVHVGRDLAAARRQLRTVHIDLVLLDIGLPDGVGFDLMEEIRREFPGMPVIFLTARNSTEDKIRGLDLGAEDYLIKPFDFHELLARIRARLRGTHAATPFILEAHDLHIDLARRSVSRGQRPIECTPKEFDALVCLARNPGLPVSRQVLAQQVWKVRSRMTSMDNVIDVLFSRLRQKVDGRETVQLIHTVRNRGYMLKVPT